MNSDFTKVLLIKLYYLSKSNSETKTRKNNAKHIIHYFPCDTRLYAFWYFLKEKKSSSNIPPFPYVRKQVNKGNHHHVYAIFLEDLGKFLILVNHHVHIVTFLFSGHMFTQSSLFVPIIFFSL